MPPLLVIIDGDTATAHELSHALAAAGFDVRGPARTLAAARNLLAHSTPDIALVNTQLSDGENGLALARELEARGVQVVMMGAGPAGWKGAYLRKPLRAAAVVDLLTELQQGSSTRGQAGEWAAASEYPVARASKARNPGRSHHLPDVGESMPANVKDTLMNQDNQPHDAIEAEKPEIVQIDRPANESDAKNDRAEQQAPPRADAGTDTASPQPMAHPPEDTTVGELTHLRPAPKRN